MKKNNIILFLLMALPTLLLTSCLKDQEDLFPESASERATNYLAAAKLVLTSAENGWLLNYYPDREQSYGGTPFTLKFDDEKVTVACAELTGDPTATVESTYILNNEDGPVLMFDTYNELMHYFSTPSGSSGAGGYQAYDGDFIFIILDISEDGNTITLKGNRSGNIMYMHRLTSTAEQYLTEVMEVEENMPVNYKFTSEGEEVAVSMASGIASFTSESIDESAAYIYTNKGVEFYEPITINGQEIKGILYGGEAPSTTTMGATIQMEVVFPPLNEIFVNNDWYIAYSKLGAYAQPYFAQARDGSAGEGETISLMAFTVANDSFCLFFNSGGYTGSLAFDVEFIGEDQVKLTYNKANNYNNGDWYIANAGYGSLVTPLERTFKLESNSKIRPTVIVMTDQSEPTNVITVTASPVSNPFDN